MRCNRNKAYRQIPWLKKYGGALAASYVKFMKDIMNILPPRYESKGRKLTSRHIKGGIFIFTIE